MIGYSRRLQLLLFFKRSSWWRASSGFVLSMAIDVFDKLQFVFFLSFWKVYLTRSFRISYKEIWTVKCPFHWLIWYIFRSDFQGIVTQLPVFPPFLPFVQRCFSDLSPKFGTLPNHCVQLHEERAPWSARRHHRILNSKMYFYKKYIWNYLTFTCFTVSLAILRQRVLLPSSKAIQTVLAPVIPPPITAKYDYNIQCN